MPWDLIAIIVCVVLFIAALSVFVYLTWGWIPVAVIVLVVTIIIACQVYSTQRKKREELEKKAAEKRTKLEQKTAKGKENVTMRNLSVVFLCLGVLELVAAIFCGGIFAAKAEPFAVLTFIYWVLGGGLSFIFTLALSCLLNAIADIQEKVNRIESSLLKFEKAWIMSMRKAITSAHSPITPTQGKPTAAEKGMNQTASTNENKEKAEPSERMAMNSDTK